MGISTLTPILVTAKHKLVKWKRGWYIAIPMLVFYYWLKAVLYIEFPHWEVTAKY